METHELLLAFSRKCAEPADFSAWAESLLVTCLESDAVVYLAANPELHWQDAESQFRLACKEIGLSSDIDAEITKCIEASWIAAFEKRQTSAAELIFTCSNLQKRLGIETIHMRLNEDKPDGTNDSGFYADSDRATGDELESRLSQQLALHGIEQGA